MARSEVFERVVEYWHQNGVPLLPRETEVEIVATFEALKQPLSEDVLGLYLTVGGHADGETDPHWFSFWSLGRIREENKHYRPANVWFADFLINSHVFCFHYEGQRVSSVYVDHNSSTCPPYPVASSVAEFFEAYLSDRNAVEAWASTR